MPSETPTTELFERASKSVVFIRTNKLQGGHFSLNLEKIPKGTGTGFIWDKTGHVVTNHHVIRDADETVITLYDGTKVNAIVVGTAPENDLAVLKIKADPKKLTPIDIGSSSDLKVGQNVYAIGNPFGLDTSLTKGIISALGREIESKTRRPILGVIQTDAAINPGNSGGPLLDSAGRCIGVNTAIYSPTGAFSGIGFAIPIDTVNRSIQQLIQFGKAVKPGLGIQIGSKSITRKISPQGVLVVNVVDGSAADKAGLQPTRRTKEGEVIYGDIILKINGVPINDSEDLFRELDKYNVGNKITLTIKRKNKTQNIPVVLTSLKP